MICVCVTWFRWKQRQSWRQLLWYEICKELFRRQWKRREKRGLNLPHSRNGSLRKLVAIMRLHYGWNTRLTISIFSPQLSGSFDRFQGRRWNSDRHQRVTMLSVINIPQSSFKKIRILTLTDALCRLDVSLWACIVKFKIPTPPV